MATSGGRRHASDSSRFVFIFLHPSVRLYRPGASPPRPLPRPPSPPPRLPLPPRKVLPVASSTTSCVQLLRFWWDGCVTQLRLCSLPPSLSLSRRPLLLEMRPPRGALAHFLGVCCFLLSRWSLRASLLSSSPPSLPSLPPSAPPLPCRGCWPPASV